MSNSRSAFRDGFKIDRLDILDSDVAYRLNTYRNWGEVDLTIDPFPKTETEDTDPINAKGTKSLFNNVHAVYYGETLRRRNNIPLIDTATNRKAVRNDTDCSIRALVANSAAGKMGRAVYNYSDFMYCKELGRVSNNYLVTLRRFPAPCGDNVLFIDQFNTNETSPEDGLQQHSPDIGRMVTWIGVSGNEMSNILKYDFKMPFKETSAEIQDASGGGDDKSSGPLGALLNGTDKQYRKYMVSGMGGDHAASYVGGLLGGDKTRLGRFVGSNGGGATYSNASWRGFRDNNKVYGPVDAIKKTTVRGDEGLDFNHSITLTFDYEMRSYDGINTKAAFLDLLGNILSVTYSTGTFWGGGYRMTSGSPQSNVFANLPIFKMAESGQLNSFSDLVDGVTNSLSSIWGQISQGEGLLGAIKTLGSSLFSMFTGAALNQLGRPTKVALNSLLEPVPTGLWHLTIGNPMHPIMVIGNLILDKTEIEHYGPLGLDDFPTGLRVTCTLHHGKPRDTTMIENMYIMGHSRVYIPMGPDIEKLYDQASEYKESEKKSFKRYASDKDYSQSGSDLEQGSGTPREAGDTVENKLEMTIKNLYFGTSNQKLILNAGKEVAFGAQPIDKKNSSANSTSGGRGGNASV
jgi:hypothetical protein